MPEYGSNGVPNYYWYPATLGEEWWLVDTEGIYELDNIQMTWNAGEEHRYLIEGSLDGESWFTLADRTENGTDDVRPYELAEGAVRFIRVTLPEGRTSDQGFGLFDAYGVEAASRSVLELTAPEPVKVEAGTAPEDMELPENVLVTPGGRRAGGCTGGMGSDQPVCGRKYGYDDRNSQSDPGNHYGRY